MTATVLDSHEPTAPTESQARGGFVWPVDFARVPDEQWAREPVDEFGLNYDRVGEDGWYKNLEPTLAQVTASLEEDGLLIDYSCGTGILANRLLSRTNHSVGVVNVDASAKYLRVAVENLGDDERTAFRLLRWLKGEKRLQRLDEVLGSDLLARGADVLTSTNAIHLYTDLQPTLESWKRALRPGGKVFVCSANIRNPNGRAGEWLLDETVDAVNEIAYDEVRREPAFARYREVLDNEELMAQHLGLREKVFVPIRPLDFYVDAFEQADLEVLHVFESTIFAEVEEWTRLLHTYHDGVLSWVGGSPKVEGREPTAEDVRNRKFLIRYCMERLFQGQSSFPCTFTYITCKA